MMGVMILLSLSLVSAMKINFFYSPTCPHCQNVIPLVNSLMQQYTESYFNWYVYDITKGSYNIQGVPLIRIQTEDCRNITIEGDQPILKQLPCELKQQSSAECPTYLNGEGSRGGSWFVQ